MLLMNLSKVFKKFNSFNLKNHTLDHIVKDISRFGALYFLDAFPFEHFNYFLKTFIKIPSVRGGSRLKDTAKATNWSVAVDERRN